jgi:RND family efflux transporter MFP subunit
MANKQQIRDFVKNKGSVSKAKVVAAASRFNKTNFGIRQLVYCLLVLIIGASGMSAMMLLRKEPEKKTPQALAPLVTVQRLISEDIPMVISDFGTVTPTVQVDVIPQVAGKIVWVNEQMKSGGFIKASDTLLKIDPSDYDLAVQQANAVVADAQVALDLEEAEAEVAIKEWKQLNPDSEPTSPLVLRKPQIDKVKARLASAQAQLDFAKLNLSRTIITLPFDTRIVTENVDLGQFVTVGQRLATAYGIHVVEIVLPIEDSELEWLDVPENLEQAQNGLTTEAIVKADFAGGEHIWQGKVTRVTGEIDKTSRLVSLVVEVQEPFDTKNDKPPLMPGMFVEVLLQGKILKNCIAVPRDAVHNGNEVWVVNEDKIHIVNIDIARADNEIVYAVKGLENDCLVVTSQLDTVTRGMAVRIKDTDPGSQDDDVVESVVPDSVNPQQ